MDELSVRVDQTIDEASAGCCGGADAGCGSASSPAPTSTASSPTIEDQVRATYDGLAESGTSILCCAPQTIYRPEELDGVPDWVLELSSGCGSPLDAVELTAGMTVADFGCGAGLDLLIAAQRVGADGRVIGVDASPHMVKTARRAAKEAGAANVDVRVGDIRRPPIRDGSVDVLMSNCVLGMFPDKEQILGEILRVLHPGGLAVISDVVYADETVPAEAAVATSATAEEFASCVVGLTAAQYRRLVSDAGFAEVTFRADGPVPYRDGAQVMSSMIFARAGERACC
ncbi:MAG: methyltransferase domain-containing protein [Nocardioides sp.]